MIKLLESLASFGKNLGAIGPKDLEVVIHLQSLIQDRGEQVAATGGPNVPRSARRFVFADLLQRIELPEVHLTLGDVSEATDHDRLTERTDFDRVSEPLAKLESRLPVRIIHRGLRRLLP